MTKVLERSPIEDRLWVYLSDWTLRLPGAVCMRPGSTLMDLADIHTNQMLFHNSAFVLARQIRFLTYISDIVLWTYDGTASCFIAIECDGHQYHEKTKEQAARDKARDRAFVCHGWRVLRFTGSEIHHYPRECVNEIRSLLVNEFQWHGQGRALSAIEETLP